MVGRMASAFPHLARRALDDGHTIANHSQNHPLRFHKFTVEQAAKEIEDGYASIRGALGESAPVSDFFRIPGLLRQTSVEQYLDSRGLMTWGVDFMADDWHRHIAPQEIVRRALARIEARGRGILLLHDIQPATVKALPVLLQELKARGYKIVHVVQAGPDQPKTATDPELWAARPEPTGLWPRIDIATAALPAPLLSVPSLQSFAVGFRPGAMVPATLAPGPDMLRTANGDIPATELWSRSAVFTEVHGPAPWTAPAAENFRYARVFRSRSAARAVRPPVTKLPATAAVVHPIGRPAPARIPAPARTRPTGHQLQLPKPTAGLRATPTAIR
jgi:hypothetical protein